MAVTVDDIQSRVAGMLDLDPDTSNISTSDYAIRLNYINRRERMWSEHGQWHALTKEYNVLASTSTGNASIALPSDFRNLVGFPKITYDGVNTEAFAQISLQEREQFDDAVSRYVIITGNPNTGYNMFVNPATTSRNLTSGASIKIVYHATPTSMASPADVVTCPNPEYLVQGVISDFWESRGDPRFQNARLEANLILQNMIEFENTPSEASYNDRVRTVEQTRHNFRLGRD